MELNRSVAVMEELRQFRWIDEYTKHVEIDFTLFNINLDMFMMVGLEVAYDKAGTSNTHFLIQTVVMDAYEWVGVLSYFFGLC